MFIRLFSFFCQPYLIEVEYYFFEFFAGNNCWPLLRSLLIFVKCLDETGDRLFKSYEMDLAFEDKSVFLAINASLRWLFGRRVW
jgi:hypothetical protein